MSSNRQTFGSLPMSQAAYLYGAMSKMTAYELAMQDQWLKQMMQQAMVVGGYSENKDGEVQIDLDSKGQATGGLTGSFLAESYQAAEEQGETFRDDAKNYIVQASMGGVGLGMTGISLAASSTSGLQDELKDAKMLQDKIKGTQAPGFEQTSETQTEAIATKLKSWETDKSSFKLADRSKPEEFDEVIKHVNGQNYNAIAKNLDEHINDIERQIQNYSQKFNNATNTVRQFTDAGNAIGGAVFTTQKATDQTAAQSDSARADVQKNVLQQEIGYITDAKQKADSFFQDAAAIASGYGQIVSTHA